MLKKVSVILGIVAAFTAISLYFVWAGHLVREGRDTLVCTEVDVCIKDSLVNHFTDREEILGTLRDNNLTAEAGIPIWKIDCNVMENLLNSTNAILTSQVYCSQDGVLHIDILQRSAIVRVIQEGNSFFLDNTGYVLTLKQSHETELPVIGGRMPVDFAGIGRGYADNEYDRQWIDKAVGLALFLEKNKVWRTYIDTFRFEGAKLILVPKAGDQTIRFGTLDNLEDKFDRLDAFYSEIIPSAGWEKYSEVSLEFNGQVVCK